MIQLVRRQSLATPRELAAQTAASGAACLSLTLVAALQIDELKSPEVPGTQGVFGSIVAFTVIALGAVVATINRLVVRENRRQHASWIIAGVTPRTVALIVTARSGLSALGGSCAAIPLVAITSSPFAAAAERTGLVRAVPTGAELVLDLLVAWLVGAVATVVISLGATSPAAIAASRAQPGRVAREEDASVGPRPLLRWLLALVLFTPPIVSTAGAMVLLAPLQGWVGAHAGDIGPDYANVTRLLDLSLSPHHRAAAVHGVVSLSLVAGSVLVLPLLARRLTLAWTIFLAPGFSSTIFLARSLAGQRVGSTASAVSSGALLIGLDLVSSTVQAMTALLVAVVVWLVGLGTAVGFAAFIGMHVVWSVPDVRPLLLAAALVAAVNAVAVLARPQRHLGTRLAPGR